MQKEFIFEYDGALKLNINEKKISIGIQSRNEKTITTATASLSKEETEEFYKWLKEIMEESNEKLA